MKLRFLPDKLTLGLCVNHTSEADEKYLPAEQVIAKVRAVDAALGRECAFVEMYNQHGSGLTFPGDMARKLQEEGKKLWLNLWPDTLPDWQTPVPEQSLPALASGAGDALVRSLALGVSVFDSPVVVCVDEPSGSPWANQGMKVVLGSLFVQFWRRLHGIFKAEAPNATLVIRYAPSWDDANDWRRSNHWWPGAEYVDQVHVNVPAYTIRSDNGTELWPLETSPGDPWTPARAMQMVLDEFSSLPGAESLPWGVGCVGSEHPSDTAYKGLWLGGLIDRLGPRVGSFSLFADDSYAKDADPSPFPRTCRYLKGKYQKPRCTSQIGVA